MRDISNITGQALPSATKLIWSTLIALAVALVLLLIAVLPAEYGIDPTGLGKKMGLTALHQPDSTAETNNQDSQAKQHTGDKKDDHSHDHNAQTHQHDDNGATEHSHTGTTAGEVLQKRTEKWRSHSLKLTLPPKQGLEIKAQLDEGERLLFEWKASGGTVSFDMHGNVVGAADDDYTSFWLGKGETQAAGTFAAPFSGLHGWYWENEGDEPVSLTLNLEGYYQDLVQY